MGIPGMTRKWLTVPIAFLLAAAPAAADLLPKTSETRVIPFAPVDGKPMIEGSVGGTEGRFMFDTGTPDAVFLNRDAVALPAGTLIGSGRTASGQTIDVQRHEALPVVIDGLPVPVGSELRSGNFGFTETVLGPDFLGFIGTPMVATGAFLLDYRENGITVLRVDPDGALAVALPPGSEVLAEVPFILVDGILPTAEARIGEVTLSLEFDTGDSGTLYLRADSLARLEARGLIETSDDRAILTSIGIGAATFDDVAVQLVPAGSPEDSRSDTGGDTLRLGASFFADRPTLWNYPARTITVLRP